MVGLGWFKTLNVGLRFKSNLNNNAAIIKTLKNSDEIKSFIEESSWSIKQLIEPKKGDLEHIKINSDEIKRTLFLSGLNSEIGKDKEEEISRALKTQMNFIKNLYDDDSKEEFYSKKSNNNEIFRLLESDHRNDKPLTLDNLLDDIQRLESRVDEEKGEVENSIMDKQLNMKGSYFSIEIQSKS